MRMNGLLYKDRSYVSLIQEITVFLLKVALLLGRGKFHKI